MWPLVFKLYAVFSSNSTAVNKHLSPKSKFKSKHSTLKAKHNSKYLIYVLKHSPSASPIIRALDGIKFTDVNDARSGRGRGQLPWGRGQNCINFFSQILHFNPIFSKNKTKFPVNFRRYFKNFGSKRVLTWGFISKHPKTTSYTFGRRLLLLCLYTE